MKPAIPVRRVQYPESDGKPMGETDTHRAAIVRHIELLQDYYEGQQVYVSGDLLVYYVEGQPKKFVVPDTFVAKGLRPGERRIFRTWIEGKVPDVVIEVTSRKTRAIDLQKKPALYARLGIREYFLFDPLHEYLNPPLQGHRLIGDGYVQLEPDVSGRFTSEELGLWLSIANNQLQFHRIDTGERLLTGAERAAAERKARQREAEARQREAEARQAAEAEVARLRAELSKLRSSQNSSHSLDQDTSNPNSSTPDAL